MDEQNVCITNFKVSHICSLYITENGINLERWFLLFEKKFFELAELLLKGLSSSNTSFFFLSFPFE